MYFTSKVRKLAVAAVGLDHELVAVAEEARVHAEIVEARIVEVAEHALLAGMRHGVRVLRAVPKVCFGAVARGASLAADEAQDLCRTTAPTRRLGRRPVERKEHSGAKDDGGGGTGRDPKGALRRAARARLLSRCLLRRSGLRRSWLLPRLLVWSFVPVARQGLSVRSGLSSFSCPSLPPSITELAGSREIDRALNLR